MRSGGIRDLKAVKVEMEGRGDEFEMVKVVKLGIEDLRFGFFFDIEVVFD